MVHQLTPAVQWRCCRKNGNYPYNHTVEPCHSLVRINCTVQRWFNYPNTSVERNKGHIQGRSSCYRSSNYRLHITPLLAKNPSPQYTGLLSKRACTAMPWKCQSMPGCRLNIYVTFLSLESLQTTQRTNKLSSIDARQIKIDRVTSKPISLRERPTGSVKLRET